MGNYKINKKYKFGFVQQIHMKTTLIFNIVDIFSLVGSGRNVFEAADIHSRLHLLWQLRRLSHFQELQK